MVSFLIDCPCQGLIDREEGNHIEALRHLQKSVELNPRNIESYKEIGRTLWVYIYIRKFSSFPRAKRYFIWLPHIVLITVG